jgi:hypothetical protein
MEHNMKMLKIFTVLTSCVWLSSCAVYTPNGAVVVDPLVHHSYSDSSGGGFCPPGQAKKGNC